MVIRESVQDKISALLRNEISSEQFENWLASISWNMHSDSSPDAIELVSSIHHLLSERDDRIVDEAEFREELQLLRSNVIYAYVLAGEPATSYFVSCQSSRPSPVVLSSVRA